MSEVSDPLQIPALVAHELRRIEFLFEQLHYRRPGLLAAATHIDRLGTLIQEVDELRQGLKECRSHLIRLIREREDTTPAIKLAANWISDWECKHKGEVSE